MNNARKFMDFLRLTELARRNCGQGGCPPAEDTMSKADEVDRARKELPSGCWAEGHDCASCHDCAGVYSLIAGLYSHLFRDGVTLPGGLLESLPERSSRSAE